MLLQEYYLTNLSGGGHGCSSGHKLLGHSDGGVLGGDGGLAVWTVAVRLDKQTVQFNPLTAEFL